MWLGSCNLLQQERCYRDEPGLHLVRPPVRLMGELSVMSLNDCSSPCSHAGRSPYGETLGVNEGCK